jgi:hypothetical protein
MRQNGVLGKGRAVLKKKAKSKKPKPKKKKKGTKGKRR